jgi:hypothetical protein
MAVVLSANRVSGVEDVPRIVAYRRPFLERVTATLRQRRCLPHALLDTPPDTPRMGLAGGNVR